MDPQPKLDKMNRDKMDQGQNWTKWITTFRRIKGSVECQMNFCTHLEEMGTLPEVKDVEENSGKNLNPVRNPATFIRSPEIIFSGLKPDRINPGKSGRIRSCSSAKSKIRFPDPEKQFYRTDRKSVV